MVVTTVATSSVVGLSVSDRAVCAVLVRAGRVLWARETLRGDERSLEESIAELLGALPKVGFLRPAVHASVGPRSAQVRDLGDLGWTRDRQIARAIVGENPGRFFLVNGTPVQTTAVQLTPTGGALVGAIDRPVVDALTAACVRHRLRLAMIAPAAAVFGHAVDASRAVIDDGDLSMIALYDGARLSGCRRIRSTELPTEHQGSLALHAGLRAIDDGERFAAAYGAARAGASVQLALRPERSGAAGRRQLVPALVASALAAVFALTVPPLAAAHRADDARERRATIARSGERALDAERRLGDAVATLREVNAFAAEKRSATLLLATLSEAIEYPTMLLSIHMDTLGGTLVALTPRASTLMTMLDTVSQIADARMIGPVTLQPSAGPSSGVTAQPGMLKQREIAALMERVTVRFGWRGEVANGVQRARSP